MKFENTNVWGFDHALRGMRNPKNSWKQSDSWDMSYDDPDFEKHGGYWIGPKDMKLAQTLIKAGPEHRKFMRQIFVSVDITAPLYWWKEFDTYKVGTVANSTSTMHKLAAFPITIDSFEHDDYDENVYVRCRDQSQVTEEGKKSNFEAHWHVGEMADYIIEHLEDIRVYYNTLIESLKLPSGDADWINETQETANRVWKEIVRWSPTGWLQTRTVTLNYENLLAMCSKGQRRFHKLNEWSGKHNPELPNFIAWARTLPYAQEFIFIDELEPKFSFVTKAFRKLAEKLSEETFHHFGVIVYDNESNMRSVKDILSDLASAFDKIEKI